MIGAERDRGSRALVTEGGDVVYTACMAYADRITIEPGKRSGKPVSAGCG